MKIHTELFTVRHSECGSDGLLKTQSLLDYFQEGAANHANDLGFGLADMRKANLLWVLSRIRTKIARHPTIGEKLQLKTWPNDFVKLFARRQFELRDEKDEIIAVASSEWLVLHADTLRIQRPEALPESMPDNADLPCFFPMLDKIQEIPVQKILYSPIMPEAIDVNQHLNNARYGAIADNLLVQLAGNRKFSEFQIDFRLAVTTGNGLLSGGIITGNTIYLAGYERNHNHLSFQLTGLLTPESSR